MVAWAGLEEAGRSRDTEAGACFWAVHVWEPYLAYDGGFRSACMGQNIKSYTLNTCSLFIVCQLHLNNTLEKSKRKTKPA